MKKRIIIISSYTPSLIVFREDLILSLLENDFDVYCLGPDHDTEVFDKLTKMGATPIQYDLKRNGLNPLKDILTIRQLRNIFRKIDPHFILPYTAKPVIYSNFAKKGLSPKSINWITGLGFYAMPSEGFKNRMAKFLMTQFYRKCFNSDDVLIFQNLEDLKLFKERKILTNQPNYITPGSGVNLNSFPFSLPNIKKLNFLFVGRLIESKGILIFLKAAEKIKSRYINVSFTVVGEIDLESPDAVQDEILDEYKIKGIAEFTGKVNNVKSLIDNSSVFVLPSMYREGIPRSILEALAMGRPVITTNNIGCKETVIDGYNGKMIEKNDVNQLIDAMEFYLENPESILTQGNNSRKMAENKFDVKKVNEIIIKTLS